MKAAADRREELPTGTVTFLFSDIEGSTRLLQALGRGYRALLERHAQLIRQSLAAHDGIEISTEGDSFFAVFRSAPEAVAAAAEIERAMAQEPWLAGSPVRVRIGLHTGEGRLGGDSYIGLDVHRAARVAAAGHGGQVLLTAPTRLLVEDLLPEGVGLVDLGAHRLKDLEHPEQIVQLAIPGLSQDFPPLKALDAPRYLPAEQSSFIGRQRELDEIASLLAGTRLLTLTGPGGTGKTRLAIRAGSQAALAFADGVFFVDLAPLGDSSLVGPTVARSLGLSEQSSRPIVELLMAYLEPREVLLILDNFEHLLPAADFVANLLSGAPRAKVLVTSRIVLNLYGEQTYAVPPLPLPDPATAAVADMPQSEAVQLFVERARAARRGFSLLPATAAAVAELCILLDGLPLAIELAASRVRLLEPPEILDRLRRHLPFLDEGPRNLPERQRTLRSTIDWSYRLLDPRQQALFARLAVFDSGCLLDAADAICNPREEVGLSTFDGLASLVEQSLIRRLDAGIESRFGMLETIREYARGALVDRDEADLVAARHAIYYRDLAETAVAHRYFLTGDNHLWLDRFEAEHDNVRAALRRFLETNDVENGLRLAFAVWRFWVQRGYIREGRDRIEAFLTMDPEGVSRSHAHAYSALGGLTYWLSDAGATERAYSRALVLWRKIGDREGEVEALYDLAYVPIVRGEYAEARRRFADVRERAVAVNRPDLVAYAESALGILIAQGGDLVDGRAYLERALEHARTTDDRFQLSWTLAQIGQVESALGHHREARARILESLAINMQAGNVPGIGANFHSMAGIEEKLGHHQEALRLLGAGAGIGARTGALAPSSMTGAEETEAAARKAVGEEAAERELATGREMTVHQAAAYARSLG